MCKYFHLQPLYGCPINVSATDISFFALSLNSPEHSHVGLVFTNEKMDKKKVVSRHNVHGYHIHDTTDLIKISVLILVFLWLIYLFSSQTSHKLTKKLQWILQHFNFFYIQSLSIEPIMFLCLGPPLIFGFLYTTQWLCLESHWVIWTHAIWMPKASLYHCESQCDEWMNEWSFIMRIKTSTQEYACSQRRSWAERNRQFNITNKVPYKLKYHSKERKKSS